MKKVTVAAKEPKSKKEGTVSINWPDTLKEGIEMFGAEAILSNALANAKITVQSGLRRMLKVGKSPDEVQKVYNEWKLGVAIARVGADPIQATLAKADSMNEKDLNDLISRLKAKIGK